jgi:hypothetical protein
MKPQSHDFHNPLMREAGKGAVQDTAILDTINRNIRKQQDVLPGVHMPLSED